MTGLNLVSLIVAICLFLGGAFLSLGPNDGRTLGSSAITVSAILAAAVLISEAIVKSRSGGSR